MKSFDFVHQGLLKLQKAIPELSFKYQHDINLEDHIVEVLPVDVYSKSVKYAELAIDLSLEFMAMFPGEDLLFVTDGSLIEVAKPDLVIESILSEEDKWDVLNSNIQVTCGQKPCDEFAAGEQNYAIAA